MIVNLVAPVSVSYEGRDYDLVAGDNDVPEGVAALIGYAGAERDPKVLAAQAQASADTKLKKGKE